MDVNQYSSFQHMDDSMVALCTTACVQVSNQEDESCANQCFIYREKFLLIHIRSPSFDRYYAVLIGSFD